MLLLAIVVSDWPTGVLSDFWAGHAMLTNIVSSLVFVVLGATLVERWLSRQENRRAEIITATALGAMANVPCAYQNALWFLLNGQAVHVDVDFRVTDAEQAVVAGILASHGFDVVAQTDVARGGAVPPEDVARLAVLLQDRQWVLTAHDLLLRTNQTARLILARWAQLMIASKETTRSLRQVTDLIDDIDEIRMSMNPINKHDRLATHADRELFVRRWRAGFVNAAVLYEDFGLTVGWQDFTRWSPELTQPEDRALMEARGLGRRARSATGRVYTTDAPPDLTLPATPEQPTG
ncbi:hypothetical protein [Actinomycetospora chlora]|uniref:hypothetical protein n=1 Tax=Actinomycetospora chlora TaxID=663608 RepID=UPI0031EF8D2C